MIKICNKCGKEFEYFNQYFKNTCNNCVKKNHIKCGKRTHELHPEEQKRWCKKAAKRMHELYPDLYKKIDAINRKNRTGIYAITKEQRIENARKGGKAGTYETHSKRGKIGGKRTKELYPYQYSEMGKIGGKRTHELHPNQSSENGKIGGKRAHELHPNQAKIWGLKYGSKAGKRCHELHPNQSSEIMKKLRKNIILPLKDTKIEIKIQDYLRELRIEFYTHQYMNIKHAYQCDIFIPSMNLVIEADGDYFHANPKYFKSEDEIFRDGITAQERWDLDNIRTKELLEKGFRVIRLWEDEIKEMKLEDFIIKLQNVGEIKTI